MKKVVFALAVSFLAACSSIPKQLQTEQKTFVSVKQSRADDNCLSGKLVRWGGAIISTKVTNTSSKIEILAKPLYGSSKPKSGNEHYGRFIAETSDYLEPEIFKPGKMVTVKGKISGCLQGKIDKMDYRFPVVKIDGKYLWPEYKESNVILIDPFFRPYPYRNPWHHPVIIKQPKKKSDKKK